MLVAITLGLVGGLYFFFKDLWDLKIIEDEEFFSEKRWQSKLSLDGWTHDQIMRLFEEWEAVNEQEIFLRRKR
jgi:hypothetical protein